MMTKIIYWRHKGAKTIAKDYILEDLGDMIEISDSSIYTAYPTRLLKTEIDIIRIVEKTHED